jgi:transcription initiation factor IIF auxiliary subunit
MSIRLALASLALMLPVLTTAQSGVTTDNTSKYIGNNRWEWTVFVKASPDTVAKIRCVEYLLHPTFPNRDRMVCDRGQTADQPFSLTANGWGVFDIPVKVIFNDGHSESMTHHLRFDAPASAAPPGCNSASDFTMRERTIQEAGANFPGVYLYAEEIHTKIASHFYVVKTTQTIDAKTFNWQQFRKAFNLKRKSTLSNSDAAAYVPVSAALDKRVPMPLSGATAAMYFKDAQEHGSVHVVICK